MARRSRKSLIKSLRRAQRHRHLIEIVRSVKGTDSLTGFVVARGDRWVLLALNFDGMPDGFAAVRVDDIRHIYWGSGRRFVRKSLKALGGWPPKPPEPAVDLDHGLRRLVDSVAAAAPLVTIHPELKRPDVCYIGRPISWGKKKLRLQEVDLAGRWGRDTVKHRKAAISRVGFNGIYETNLAVVAGEQPPLKNR